MMVVVVGGFLIPRHAPIIGFPLWQQGVCAKDASVSHPQMHIRVHTWLETRGGGVTVAGQDTHWAWDSQKCSPQMRLVCRKCTFYCTRANTCRLSPWSIITSPHWGSKAAFVYEEDTHKSHSHTPTVYKCVECCSRRWGLPLKHPWEARLCKVPESCRAGILNRTAKSESRCHRPWPFSKRLHHLRHSKLQF